MPSCSPPATTPGGTPLAFLAGAALAVTAGTMVAYWVTDLLERAASPGGEGTVKTVIDWLVIGLFLFLMVRTYLRRKTAEEPRWMGRLHTADAGFSFRLGLLLFLVMPTDIITMFTVGASLTRHGQPWWHSLPFVLVTLLLVGLPLIDPGRAEGRIQQLDQLLLDLAVGHPTLQVAGAQRGHRGRWARCR